MTETEIADCILARLYHQWERHEGGSVFELGDDMPGEVDPEAFEKAAAMLEQQHLIRNVGQSVHCDITARGINEAENSGLTEYETYQRYWKLRHSILAAAAAVYEERPRQQINAKVLLEQSGHDETEFFNNAQFLADSGLLEFNNSWDFRITDHGLAQFRRVNFVQLLTDDFAAISKLAPQARGIRFEKLLARVVISLGWNTNESARTAYEEFDIFIDRNGSYYLIECKWTKNPAGPDVTSHLLAKLMRRESVKGILMSMSGFTRGAVTSVEDLSSSKIILFFGPKDVEQIVKEPKNFDELLMAKEREFVTHRKINWS